MDLISLLPNLLALVSVILYVATLTPTLCRIFLKPAYKTKFIKYLNRYRRQIGIWAWVFGLAHGIAISIKYQLDFTQFSTYIKFFQGLSLITIFTILAVTSNDLSVKKLKKNWKKIHSLTYLAAFLLVWHIADKMAGKWTFVTPVALFLSILFALLLLVRFVRYLLKKQKKNSQ